MGSIATLQPSLETGDRLSLHEFRRRYESRKDIKKAEWIGGVVYVSSPVRFSNHALPHGILISRLGAFLEAHPEVLIGDNATLRLAGGDVQPDVMLRYGVSRGGRSQLDETRYVVGSPELVAEIAFSSASYDLHTKKDLYRDNGILEYLVWRVEDEAIDWFALGDDGEYERLQPGPDGRTKSRVFAGLELDLPRLLAAAHVAFEESGLSA